MFQKLDGHTVYVVDLTPELPELPIVGWLPGEKEYEAAISGGGLLGRTIAFLCGTTSVGRTKSQYAEALQDAIETGIITKPGKYAIHIDGLNYSIAAVNEPPEEG